MAQVGTLAMMDLGLEVLKVLAVLGGVSVGGVGAGLLLRGLARLLTRKPVPQPALRLVQGLGAVALGIGVWLWVYGQGGGGFGWGGRFGAGGAGQGKGEGEGKNAQTVAVTPSTAKETPAPPSKTEPPGAVLLRIEMLGGQRVQEQRFYRLVGDLQPRSLAELRQAVEERRKDAQKPPVKGIEIIIYEDSVAKDHPAVRDLEQWAREHELIVSLSFPEREAP